jgi:hypothetical protein
VESASFRLIDVLDDDVDVVDEDDERHAGVCCVAASVQSIAKQVSSLLVAK